jgi:hypothetical protein
MATHSLLARTSGTTDRGTRSVSVSIKKNVFIILSGGPGVYDARDPQHDKSWDNYVTPPLLLSKKHPIHNTSTEELHWLVYEPAYEKRWKEDSSVHSKTELPTQSEHAKSIKDEGFSNYLAKLKSRAADREWHYKGIHSAQEFWDYINGLEQKMSRVWFYGHARNDLWLSLGRNGGTAVKPEAHAVVKVVDITKLKAQSFVPQTNDAKPHKFFGCNTDKFASAWAKTLKVYAEGAEQKVSFAEIHKTGGRVTLVSGATWRQYSNTGKARELIVTAGATVN